MWIYIAHLIRKPLVLWSH